MVVQLVALRAEQMVTYLAGYLVEYLDLSSAAMLVDMTVEKKVEQTADMSV